MEFRTTEIEGLFLIKPFVHSDERGTFVKTFREDKFNEHGLDADFKESFYSESVKGVVRGMHFQLPPHEHAKLVFCMSGEILDVVVDLRKNSPTYGKFQAFELTAENKHMLYLPKGMAHGFCSLSESGTLYYLTGSVHNPASDTGIRYDSFGFEWPVANLIVSDRDKSFIPLKEFDSPF